jgi:hypothetical protein
VSSDEQAKADRFSLPAQRKEIESYCANRGWTLVRVYVDEGHSARGADLNKRPAFKQMLADLRVGAVRADVIVTHTLDRFARNMVVALTTLAEMHQLGITYSSVTESDFDYSNPDKRLHLSIRKRQVSVPGSRASGRQGILSPEREETADALPLLRGTHHDRDPPTDDAGLSDVSVPRLRADVQ